MATTRDLTGIKCEDNSCDKAYYTCGRCQRIIHKQSWNRLSKEQKDYDRMVDPLGAYTSGLSAPGGDYEEDCCSCHINPPCGYCERKNNDDEEESDV